MLQYTTPEGSHIGHQTSTKPLEKEAFLRLKPLFSKISVQTAPKKLKMMFLMISVISINIRDLEKSTYSNKLDII